MRHLVRAPVWGSRSEERLFPLSLRRPDRRSQRFPMRHFVSAPVLSHLEENDFRVSCFVRMPRWLCRRLRIASLVPTVVESGGTGRNGSVNKFFSSSPVCQNHVPIRQGPGGGVPDGSRNPHAFLSFWGCLNASIISVNPLICLDIEF